MATSTETGNGQIGLDAIEVTDAGLFKALADLEMNDQERAGSPYPRLMKDRAEILDVIKGKLGLEADGAYEFIVKRTGENKAVRRFKATIRTTDAHEVDGGTRKRITPHYDE